LQLRGEKLEGMYRQAQHISDQFTNTEFGIGIDCGYLRGGRVGLEFGLELASGDIFIIHEDDFLAGSLSAPQVSVKGSLGLTVLSLGRFDLTLRGGFRKSSPMRMSIEEMRIKHDGGMLNLTSFARFHTKVMGSLLILEAGTRARFRISKSLSILLDAMWQRYNINIKVDLDEYAQEVTMVVGSIIVETLDLNRALDFALATPAVEFCFGHSICASASIPLAIMGEDRWLRGVSFKLSAPFF